MLYSTCSLAYSSCLDDWEDASSGTAATRSTQAVVSGVHRLQVGSACFTMPAWSRSRLSLSVDVDPTCWRLQRRCLRSSSSSLLVSDPTNTAFHRRRPCLSSRRESSLEQPATRRHISSDSRCFPKASQNFPAVSHLLSHLNFVPYICTVQWFSSFFYFTPL